MLTKKCKMNNDSMTANFTEVDYGEHSVGTIISLSIAYGLLSLTAFVGNFIVIWIICKSKKVFLKFAKVWKGCKLGGVKSECKAHPHLCAKPRHFCKLVVATSKKAFLELKLPTCSTVYHLYILKNCPSDTPYMKVLKLCSTNCI